MRRPDRVTCLQPVILASASPRRRDLLETLGVPFLVVVADVDEAVHPGEAPEALASRLAGTKAATVAERIAASNGQPVTRLADALVAVDPDALILAADTVVTLDGAILGKPRDAAEARSMLAALRGRAHRVLTGVSLRRGKRSVWSSVAETTVWMRPYGDDEIAAYVASGRPLDKAGAYGIQDTDFRPVERIDGCYTNVVGLPLCEVERALGAVGYAGRPEAAQCDRWALDSTSQRPT